MTQRKPKPACPDQELVLREDVSRIICRSLNRLNWTQKFLASKAGYSQQYVSRVLACKVNLSFEAISRLCFALGVQPVLLVEKPDKAQC